MNFRLPVRILSGGAGTAHVTIVLKLLSFFASLLAIALARQSRLYAFLFTGLQIVGVTLDFLDDVFLLYLPLEPAKRIFQRLAFLHTNFCQSDPTSKPANWLLLGYRKDSAEGQTKALAGKKLFRLSGIPSKLLPKALADPNLDWFFGFGGLVRRFVTVRHLPILRAHHALELTWRP
jgi:hypothetical protein